MKLIEKYNSISLIIRIVIGLVIGSVLGVLFKEIPVRERKSWTEDSAWF